MKQKKIDYNCNELKKEMPINLLKKTTTINVNISLTLIIKNT